jgi:hypothetical protein
MAKLEEFMAMKEALPGWNTSSEIQALDRSRRVFAGNRDELQRFLGEHLQPPAFSSSWTSKPGGVQQVLGRG